jgi:hypothetical protein
MRRITSRPARRPAADVASRCASVKYAGTCRLGRSLRGSFCATAAVALHLFDRAACLPQRSGACESAQAAHELCGLSRHAERVPVRPGRKAGGLPGSRGARAHRRLPLMRRAWRPRSRTRACGAHRDDRLADGRAREALGGRQELGQHIRGYLRIRAASWDARACARPHASCGPPSRGDMQSMLPAPQHSGRTPGSTLGPARRAAPRHAPPQGTACRRPPRGMPGARRPAHPRRRRRPPARQGLRSRRAPPQAAAAVERTPGNA